MKSFLAQCLVSADSAAGNAASRLIVLYQKTVSPGRGIVGVFIGGTCRFYPSCSDYTRDALRQYGLLKGSMVSLMRIARCAPWGAGGYDPVTIDSR